MSHSECIQSQRDDLLLLIRERKSSLLLISALSWSRERGSLRPDDKLLRQLESTKTCSTRAKHVTGVRFVRIIKANVFGNCNWIMKLITWQRRERLDNSLTLYPGRLCGLLRGPGEQTSRGNALSILCVRLVAPHRSTLDNSLVKVDGNRFFSAFLCAQVSNENVFGNI